MNGLWTKSKPEQDGESHYIIIDVSIKSPACLRGLTPLLHAAFAKCGIEYTPNDPAKEIKYRRENDHEQD